MIVHNHLRKNFSLTFTCKSIIKSNIWYCPKNSNPKTSKQEKSTPWTAWHSRTSRSSLFQKNLWFNKFSEPIEAETYIFFDRNLMKLSSRYQETFNQTVQSVELNDSNTLSYSSIFSEDRVERIL